MIARSWLGGREPSFLAFPAQGKRRKRERKKAGNSEMPRQLNPAEFYVEKDRVQRFRRRGLTPADNPCWGRGSAGRQGAERRHGGASPCPPAASRSPGGPSGRCGAGPGRAGPLTAPGRLRSAARGRRPLAAAGRRRRARGTPGAAPGPRHFAARPRSAPQRAPRREATPGRAGLGAPVVASAAPSSACPAWGWELVPVPCQGWGLMPHIGLVFENFPALSKFFSCWGVMMIRMCL